MDERTPSYMAYLPAKVRYDPELRPNAKLLYAEITALADAKGYCWASNAYFSKLFDMVPKSISRLISLLGEKGYIMIEVIRDASTNAVVKRRLWVDTPIHQKEDTPPHPEGTPIHQKEGTHLHQKVEENVTSIERNTPYSPPEAKQRKKELPKESADLLNSYVAEHPVLRDTLKNFVDARMELPKAKHSPAAYKALLSRLDRFSSGDDAVKADMLSLAASAGWITVYEPKARDRPAARDGGEEDDRVVE